ncbi:SRPBCC family protein [Psychrobacillus lasiicapitis]|uniref:SRPBCC family protein n=1 Tax=Psychrobacillus lasiicapitis TaxID=1636719 RepID=A0A544T4Z6_9BACI|nr:SRPBCC family protein [Psychrobacillus lasiicapitis]TQR12522.1 SRPBCC family protein [Psychrobacillus lasiicapitis]GGA38818.1 hypothetical protein GCM10011384_30440 [Psychrobacillus lasiicapitis]
MPKIIHETYIEAPLVKCFDLARSVEKHIETTSNTNEKAVAGVTTGLLQLGDSVTWEAIHFGVKQKLTAKIVAMEAPQNFTDVMIRGAFHSFTHIHIFTESYGGTIMKDVFTYRAPFGVLGKIADHLFLEKYMKNFIISRASELKKIAEKNIEDTF